MSMNKENESFDKYCMTLFEVDDILMNNDENIRII